MSRLGLAGVVLLALLLGPVAVSAQMSPQQRTQVSDQMARDIARTGEIAELTYQQQRVGLVFAALLRHVQRHDVNYRVAVQRSKEVNAYALPDGRIIVTTELLRRLPPTDSNAVAFVLGHELSHVEKHHAERQAQQDAAARVLIGVVAGRSDDWVRILGSLSRELVSSGYSRGMEAEADKSGLELMSKAGYDPNGALTTLRLLASLEGSGLRVFPTHPKATDRYKACVAWMNAHNVPVSEKAAASPKAAIATRPAPKASVEAGSTRAGFGQAKGASRPASPRPTGSPNPKAGQDGNDAWTDGPMRFAPEGLLAQSPRPVVKPSSKPSTKPSTKPAKASPRPSASPSAAPSPDSGLKMLPRIVLRDRAGKKVPLARYLGKKPIILYLYNAPVDQTAVDLQNLQAQMDNLGVQAIAIHGDRARRDRAQQQFMTVAIAYPVLLDNGTVARYYAVTGDPTVVLVATDGHEITRWVNFGAVDKLSVQIKDALQTGLGTPGGDAPK